MSSSNTDRIILALKSKYKNSKIWHLGQEDEIRISDIQDFIRLRLIEGEAEVFGRELPLNETVFFYRDDNISIFSWLGAKIEIEDHEDVFQERKRQGYDTHPKNPMREMVNLNHILEQMRISALNQKIIGPRVFITGNPQSGKTSFCKILINYSLKLGWTPLFVDIDLTKNMISTPGCMSATLIEDFMDGCSDNFSHKSINYFHGACQPNGFIITPDYFDYQINQLSQACHQKLESDIKQFQNDNQLDPQDADQINSNVNPIFPRMFGSGMFINGFTPTHDVDKKALISAIKAFNTNIVIVVDDQNLEDKIRKNLNNDLEFMKQNGTHVVYINKPNGVVNKQPEPYKLYQEYFKGKNHEFTQRKEQIQQRIKQIKDDVDNQNEQEFSRIRATNPHGTYSTPIVPVSEGMQGPQNTAPKLDTELFMISLLQSINEFQTFDLRINVSEYKIFEIKCNEMKASQLPAGEIGPKYFIEFQRIHPYQHNVDQIFMQHKFKIAGVMLPRDQDKMTKIEYQMQLNKNNLINQDYEECLKQCICLETVQIKDFHPNPNPIQGKTQSNGGFLEVRTTRTGQSSADTQLNSKILFIGKINLGKMV